jgi:hypothetical protein
MNAVEIEVRGRKTGIVTRVILSEANSLLG